MKISDSTSISLPARNLLAILAAVAIGTMSYFSVIERLNKIETTLQRTLALEDDSLQLSLGVLSYRIYPIQGLGKAPKGFYLGPRLYKGAINEVPDEGDGAWREVVRGIGIGVETGFQFNFDFGMVVDLGIGFNFSDQVIQFSGDETEDGFTVWPHPNVGIGWKF